MLVGTSVGVAGTTVGMPAVFVGIADGVLVVPKVQADKTREVKSRIGETNFLSKATFFHPVNCKIILPAPKTIVLVVRAIIWF